MQCSHFEELAPRKKFCEKERDVSQVIPLVASRWRGSDTKWTLVKTCAGGSTAALVGTTGGPKEHELARAGSGNWLREICNPTNFGRNWHKETPKEGGERS